MNNNLTSIKKIEIDDSLTVDEKLHDFKNQGLKINDKYYFKSHDGKRIITCNFSNTYRKVNVTEEILLNILENSLQ